MRIEDARKFIIEAATIPNFRKFTFTGGEPFLFQKEHEELISLCKGLGLFTRVVTNGFWAKTHADGMRVLSRMQKAGLDEINFSADKYHLEFLDAQVLRNALDCGRELGYARIISFVTNTDIPPLDDFSQMYGIPREQLEDLRPLLDNLGVVETMKDEKIFVFAGGLIGLGRAAEHPNELRYFPVGFFPESRACGEVINKPVIYPNGDLQACCCAGGKIKTFFVGNLHQTPISELYERMTERAHYQMINAYGPKELYKVIAKARPDIPRKGTYTSICEVCVRATEGLTPDEVDTIVNQALLERTLKAFGAIADTNESNEVEPLIVSAPVRGKRELPILA
jgi:MoaA/NifB/PqqE/SkfB family radical SAM enzyme